MRVTYQSSVAILSDFIGSMRVDGDKRSVTQRSQRARKDSKGRVDDGTERDDGKAGGSARDGDGWRSTPALLTWMSRDSVLAETYLMALGSEAVTSKCLLSSVCVCV